MASAGKYIIVYDISSNRERLHISRVLQGFGFRVQKSVFECMLEKASRRKLIRQLEELNIETGSVFIYRVNNNAKRRVVGVEPGPGIDDDFAYVV